jgi:hypothetical protein
MASLPSDGCAEVVLPLAQHAWPRWVAARDCDETYGFI